MASVLFKKFQDELAKKDAEYKAWEEDLWKQHGALWEKEGYKRSENPNSAWGSTWTKKQTEPTPKKENINIADYSDLQTSITNTIQGINNLELPSSGLLNGFGLFGQGSNPLAVKGTAATTPVSEKKSQYASYEDVMKQPWARHSYLGTNRGYVDENGKRIVDADKHTGKKYPVFVTTNLYKGLDSHNDLSYAYDEETGQVRRLFENWFGKTDGWADAGATGVVNNGGWESLSDMLAKYNITYKKQGGTMNKVKYFQQGGQALNIEQQVIALVQAAMSGNQKATQQVNQIMEAAKAGDQQAALLAQMIQAVAQKLQGQATMNKWGSKLQYIRSLKFAKGGKNCSACMAAGGQTQEKSNAHIAPSDTVHVQGKPKSLVDSQGKKTVKHLPEYTASDYQKDLKDAKKGKKDAAKRVEKQDMKTAYGCGGKAGKAKKRYFGGWL